MSQAVDAVLIGPESLPVPRRSSLKQVGLAREILAADLTVDTWSDIFRRAGYSEITALSSAKDIRDRPGVQRALVALRASQADKARDLTTVGIGLISSANKEEISDRDKIALGAALVKTGHEIGETVEQRGEGSGWKQRLSRAVLFGYRLGFIAGIAGSWGLKRHRIPPPTATTP